MSRQSYLCPWKLYHALTVCQPIFQKLFHTLGSGTIVNTKKFNELCGTSAFPYYSQLKCTEECKT